MAIKSVLLFIYFFIFASPCYAHLFILTYGDDFTEGYVGHSQIPLAIAMTPYGKTMEQYLNKKI